MDIILFLTKLPALYMTLMWADHNVGNKRQLSLALFTFILFGAVVDVINILT